MIVWPALLPAEYRATRWAFSASRSTILPLPSSPHCPPMTTTADIDRGPATGPSFQVEIRTEYTKAGGHGQGRLSSGRANGLLLFPTRLSPSPAAGLPASRPRSAGYWARPGESTAAGMDGGLRAPLGALAVFRCTDVRAGFGLAHRKQRHVAQDLESVHGRDATVAVHVAPERRHIRPDVRTGLR